MKRFFLTALCALLCLTLACAALAEGREAPDEKTFLSNEINATAIYRLCDQQFYDSESLQPGTVVRLDYTTDVYGDPIDTWANVYLPYGYDENTPYNIIYFMHGTTENQESFIGQERCKNAIDNMIEVGISEPVIMVFPTYYYDYETRATDHQTFVTEVRKDLMPAVESTYHTYAETADEAGFIASRQHRAFSGYSQGGAVTWTLLSGMIDYSKYFLPFSGTFGDCYDTLKTALDNYSEYADEFFLFMACGSKRDLAYADAVTVTNKILEDKAFSFGIDPTSNNFYSFTGQEIHQTMMARFYFYNAFEILFK